MEPTERRLDMCWLKSLYFFVSYSHTRALSYHWLIMSLTKVIRRCECLICHVFPLFFLCLFTAVARNVPRGWLEAVKSSEWPVLSPMFLHSLSQCTLCFLFLCFLSFFLPAHFTQNHCWSSGGAETIPTQGLGGRKMESVSEWLKRREDGMIKKRCIVRVDQLSTA